MIDPVVATLLGAALGCVGTLVATLANNGAALRREKLKLNDAQRRTAYGSLFKLAYRLRTDIFPLAEHKKQSLIWALDKHFDSLDFACYSDRVIKILDRLDDVRISESHPDLVSEDLIPKQFFEDELLDLVSELFHLSREEMRVRV